MKLYDVRKCIFLWPSMYTTLPRGASISFNYRRVLVYGCVIITTLICMVYGIYQRNRTIDLSKSLSTWSKSEERIKRPSFVNEDHGFCGPCPPEKQISTAWQLKDLITHTQPTNSFLLNIGAASLGGGRYDPTYPILASTNLSFAALLIDPNSNPTLFNAYPKRDNIRITHDYIWAETIVQDVFVKYDIPQQFALLKVDIDSYECALLETILQANYRPELIHTEFNPIFPPPIVFMPIYNATTKQDWQPPLWANAGFFYGCSLSALSKVMAKFHYVLLQVEFWDVIYIQEDIARSKSIQVPASDHVAYADGFLGHSCFPYCQRNRKIYDPTIDRTIKTNQNRTNFVQTMISVIDPSAPKSIKANLTHPYLLEV